MTGRRAHDRIAKERRAPSNSTSLSQRRFRSVIPLDALRGALGGEDFALSKTRNGRTIAAGTGAVGRILVYGEEEAMATYVHLLAFTEQGLRNIKDTVKRA